MVYEANLVELNTATEDIGAPWLDFTDGLIPEQAELINRSYDLISLTLRENMLSTVIYSILIDENIEYSNKVNLVRKTLIESMVELITKMGVIINIDYVTLEEMEPLCDILDVFYSTDDIDDVLGLIDILDNDTYDNKDKLIQIILRYLQKESYESDALDYIIEEVSGDVIKGLYIGLGVLTIEDGDYLNPDIARRIKANIEFLKGTIAYEHVVDGGGVGLSYDVYCSLFINEISASLIENPKTYMREMMGICLISSLTNIEIEEGFASMINDYSESMEDIYYSGELLRKVNL